MKNATINYQVGQRLILQMIKSERGNMPIARTEEGIICLISRENKGFYPYFSIWTCEVVTVHENKLIVKPVRLETTAEKAQGDAVKSAQEAFGKQKPDRSKHARKSYQYASSTEKKAFERQAEKVIDEFYENNKETLKESFTELAIFGETKINIKI